MEKNTIFAFVLCLLVLIVWFFISSKQQDKVPVIEKPQGQQETAQTELTEKSVQQPPISPTPAQGDIKKEILPTRRETEKEILVRSTRRFSLMSAQP